MFMKIILIRTIKKSLKIIPNYGIGQLKILVTFGNQLLYEGRYRHHGRTRCA